MTETGVLIMKSREDTNYLLKDTTKMNDRHLQQLKSQSCIEIQNSQETKARQHNHQDLTFGPWVLIYEYEKRTLLTGWYKCLKEQVY